MKKAQRCIMLVDDNPEDNFFHKREIKKIDPDINVITKEDAAEALEYLKSVKHQRNLFPDLIFLDINMPGMNGWEFLEAYNALSKDLQSKAIIIMLTTSENPDDDTKARKWNFVSDFSSKPLTREIMDGILDKYFHD